ncbi:RAC-alpha serine/threonine-protein kinase isoform X2 [Genypterus blacodes]|uniref:RAC-alpha serine/threonine-protein kinase isoform X2 n=1 Tax=Genypterus blacodes TaxID=154954 RepID=UPI003F75D4A1
MADYGLSNEEDDGDSEECSGAPDYLAPEILQDSDYSRLVDWWCLGLVMYQLMCGRLPFFNRDREILIDHILTKEVRFPLALRPEALSSEAGSLLSGLLQTQVRRRS